MLSFFASPPIALLLFYTLVTALSGRLVFKRSFSSLSSTHLLADNAALFFKSCMSTHRLMISFVAPAQLALFLLQALLPGRSGDSTLRIQFVLVTSAVLVRCRIVQSTLLESFILLAQTRIFRLATSTLESCSYGCTPHVSWLVTGSLASNLRRTRSRYIFIPHSPFFHIHNLHSCLALHNSHQVLVIG